jgi:hypothetical protein
MPEPMPRKAIRYYTDFTPLYGAEHRILEDLSHEGSA